MSMDQYSTNPAANDLTNYFKTGMRPSAVKTAGWDIMADLAQLFNAIPAGAGTANVQTLANPRPFAALTAGLVVIYKPTVANTASMTLNVDGLGAKNVNTAKDAAQGTCRGGELQLNYPAILKYDGTRWQLLNPAWTAPHFVCNTGFSVSGGNALTPSGGWETPIPTALIEGMIVTSNMAAGGSGTTQVTLNVNGLGAKNCYYRDGVTPLRPLALLVNVHYDFQWNSLINGGSGGYICLNPSRYTFTFSLTLGTGFATTPSANVTAEIEEDGITAYLTLPALTATSNAAGSFQATGWPAALQPVTTKRVAMQLEDNGTVANGVMNLSASGTITCGLNLAGTGGWTATGTKGFIANTHFSLTLS